MSLLLLLLLVPFLGGLIVYLLGRSSAIYARYATLALLALLVLLALSLWGRPALPGGPWLEDIRLGWIPLLGISLHLAVDGLSLPLIVLTGAIAFVAVLYASDEITHRQGEFFLALLWLITGIIGVFLALDLFVLLLFWELMLIPAFLLFFWGGEKSFAASIKFLIFTQVGGLLMMAAIILLALLHHAQVGMLSFDYADLLAVQLDGGVSLLLLTGFLAAFLVKLPVFPLHSWAPDAYAESPTIATVVFSALMAKTAGYGLLRFAIPLFPEAAAAAAPVLTALGAFSIIYAAWLAFGQRDLKRLLAYSSVSHMGFVLVGVYAWTQWALQGALFVMLAHGISSAALFLIAHSLERRLGTRDMREMGGLWAQAPVLAAFGLFFAIASLGLPGMANFVGEFLVLLGAFQNFPLVSAVGAVGLVLGTVFVQKVFHGEARPGVAIADVRSEERVALALLAAATLLFGLMPQIVFDRSSTTFEPRAGQQEMAPAMELAGDRLDWGGR